MSTKNTGKFALVHRVLDKNGNKTDTIRARITDDIVLKKGQVIFFNDFEEDVNNLVENNIITREDAIERIETRARLDKEYNQSTMYSLRAGTTPEEYKAQQGSGDKL